LQACKKLQLIFSFVISSSFHINPVARETVTFILGVLMQASFFLAWGITDRPSS
jgi:hypothetical protein